MLSVSDSLIVAQALDRIANRVALGGCQKAEVYPLAGKPSGGYRTV